MTIAHRLSTIRKASVILVLTEDGIAEKGSHEELMALKGVDVENLPLEEIIRQGLKKMVK